MKKNDERSRVLVATRSLTRENMTGIALLVAMFFAALMAILIPALARAETPPPPVGFAPGTFEGGTEPATEGEYYFGDTTKYPGGLPAKWRVPPATSEKPTGEGFPQVTAQTKCTLKVASGAVSVACPGLERELKGRFIGVIGVKPWRESASGVDGPVTKLGAFVYLQMLSVPGHVYHSSVAASPKGHDKEMVLVCEPGGNAEATFDVQFVHQDVAKPAAGAARPGATPTK